MRDLGRRDRDRLAARIEAPREEEREGTRCGPPRQEGDLLLGEELEREGQGVPGATDLRAADLRATGVSTAVLKDGAHGRFLKRSGGGT
ncbi:MAG: hypothetical protein ACAI25_02050 [Planctomycetota bacterium]